MNKLMEKILSLFLCVIMLVSIFPTSIFAYSNDESDLQNIVEVSEEIVEVEDDVSQEDYEIIEEIETEIDEIEENDLIITDNIEDNIIVDEVDNYASEIKKQSEVLYKIMYENWDPFSSNMTLNEFYDLMNLYQTGILPLSNHIMTLALNDTQSSSNLVPRTMFLFNGITTSATGDDAPLAYPPSVDDVDIEFYPEGLDPTGIGYTRPPMNWSGVSVSPDDKGQLVAAVIVKNANSDDPTIASNVDQSLFPKYDGYYVSKVVAENVDAAILGVIEKSSGEYVYFYLSEEDQNTTVSSTVLKAGQKFIVNYIPREFAIDYVVELNDVDVTTEWVDKIFGENRLSGTVDGKLGFSVSGPYFYETEVFLRKPGEKDKSLTTSAGTSTTYPLGREISYIHTGEFNIIPDTENGPASVVWRDVFNIQNLTGPCTIVAKLTEKPTPHFDAGSIIVLSPGSGGVGGGARGTNAISYVTVKERGSTDPITVPYDYEDESLYRLGLNSKYVDYPNNGNWPNIMNFEGRWSWNNEAPVNSDMKENEDGTYSFSWTFQTNSGSGGYTLDSIAVNGISMSIPSTYKYDFSSSKYIVNSNNGYYSEITLPDGAIARFEFLSVFTSGKNQRVYHLSVTGASSDVTVTAINLKQGTGSDEFVVGGLNGVYGGDDQTNYGVEVWGVNNLGWLFKNGGSAIVLGQSESIDFNGDPNIGNANIRFKLKDGYSSPYFYFHAEGGITVGQNSSVELDRDNNVLNQNPIKELQTSGVLEPGYIYGPDNDGYYYMRLTGLEGHKFANLTVNARPVVYAIRYMPNLIPEYQYEDGHGKVINIPEHDPTNMPTFIHSVANGCHPSFWDASSGVKGEQYDDYDGLYYDMLLHNEFVISSTVPTDPFGYYKFSGWQVVNSENQAIDGLVYKNNDVVDLTKINQYGILNDSLGGNNIDISVIRLVPTWEPLKHPFKYSVVLDWVDAQGILHQEHFSDYWEDILTESQGEDNSLTVFVNTSVNQMMDWIAQHPTYTFWDEVNNAVDDDTLTAAEKIEKSLNHIIPSLKNDSKKYNEVLNALLNRTSNGTRAEAFTRLGGYSFDVHEDGGTVVIWMYENKGGLIFHEDIQQEGFIYDDEFYFTVDNVEVGTLGILLNNIYKAYPEHAYNSDGTERLVTDSDAWLVKFENGKIANIVKNDGSDFPEEPVTYFTLKHNEGIMLYVPDGSYTIVQLGSKSGGKYRVAVEYDGDFEDDKQDGWEIPNDENLWLKGSMNSRHENSSDIMQVAAKVQFEIGEDNVVHKIIFHDRTSSLSIQKEIISANTEILYDLDYNFNVWLSLPDEDTPLINEQTNNYYYVAHLYDSNNSYLDEIIINLEKSEPIEKLEGNNIWKGHVSLKGGYHLIIVMQVLQDDINYYVEEDIPTDAEYRLHDKVNDVGYITSGGLETAIFWNTDFKPGLTITENVVGPNSNVNNAVFNFEIRLSGVLGNAIIGEQTFNIMYVRSDGSIESSTITFINGVAQISLHSGDSATIESLPGGLMYNVTQLESNYFVNHRATSGVIPKDDTTLFANFENALPLSITINKTVSGTAGEHDKDFDFILVLTQNEFEFLDDFTINDERVNIVKTTNGYEVLFNLKDGENITINEIPYLTNYILRENNEDYTVKVNNSLIGLSYSESTSGSLTDDLVVNYENIRNNGTLRISKQVQDPDNELIAGEGDEYEFLVKFKIPNNIEFNKDNCTFMLYTGRTPQLLDEYEWIENLDETIDVVFNLKHGQSVVINELPPGTEYIVTETITGNYNPEYNENNSSIIADTEKLVSVINSKQENETIDLTINNTVTGSYGSKTKQFDFELILTGDNIPQTLTITKNGVSTEVQVINNKISFTLANNESIVISDVPVDLIITLKETTIGYTTYMKYNNTETQGQELTFTTSEDTTIDVFNSLDGLIPTNVHFNTSINIHYLLLCMCCLFICIVVFKHKQKD